MAKPEGSVYERVMIVDDNELDHYATRRMIEGSGFSGKLYEHSSATNALEFMKNISVAGLTKLFPDIIFLDLRMPVKDGFPFIEFYKKMLESQSLRSKLVLLSASKEQEDQYKAVISDAIFLRKPLTKEVLDHI
jgi:CheY-like chemotaxis protein